jgi:hypothetical protein
MVENFEERLCPFTLEQTGLGEMIQFGIAKTFRTVLEAFGLLFLL